MQVLLTIDVEAHRVVDEITGPKHDSLGRILSLLAPYGVKGTFFVDLCGTNTWGEEVVRGACNRIMEGGHEIELHVHPHHSSSDARRWLLSEYSYEEQRVILREAIERYSQFVGAAPYAFRAGGFGLDDNTVELLRSSGITIDCSYMWRRDGCEIRPLSKGLPSLYRGISELPMTPVIALGTRRRPLRVGPLDFNWLPLFVLKAALTRLRAASAPVAVLLLHSSSMYVRFGKKQLFYRRENEEKLEELLAFLRAGDFQTATVKEAAEHLRWDTEGRIDDGVDLAHGIPVQYAILLFQSIIGFGISGKFRAFLLANIAVIALLVSLTVWLIWR